MADTSPAEIMLDSLIPAQHLIRRLQNILKTPLPYVGTNPPSAIKAQIAALQDSVQRRIDKLTAQREEAVTLIQQIPDQTARTVIELRYGLVGSDCEKVPWLKMEELVNYGHQTIFRYHRKGIEQLNELLKTKSEHK